MPENSQIELIQLVKLFLLVRPNFVWRFNFTFDNPRNFESHVMTAVSFKEEFSVLKCSKTFKIIFLSLELIALPLIAAGQLDARDFITFLFCFIVA